MHKTINDLRVGSVIRFGTYSPWRDGHNSAPIEWYKADKDNRLLSRYCIDFLIFDEFEANDIGAYVSNTDYSLSNIHQFLNSEDEVWFSPSHPADKQPAHRPFWRTSNRYAEQAGFLANFDLSELACMEETTIQNNVNDSRFPARVWLPSALDISAFPLFKRAGVRAKMTSETYRKAAVEVSDLQPSSYCPYWLRDCTFPRTNRIRVVRRDAALGSAAPVDGIGVRPIIKLAKETKVIPDGDGYTVVGNASAATPTDEMLYRFLGMA